MLLLLISILILSHKGISEKIMPVVLLDADKVTSADKQLNPFHKICTSKFEEIIQDAKVKSDVVLIFVEKQFSVEDVTRKDKDGTAYKYLSQIVEQDMAKYFPAVIEPFKLLNQVFPRNNDNTMYIKTMNDLEMSPLRYAYIYFIDNNSEERMESMKRHDNLIKEIYSTFRKVKNGHITAFYTGEAKLVQVDKERITFLPIKPIPVPDVGVLVVSSGALFRFSGVYSSAPNKKFSYNQLPYITNEKWYKRSLSTKMAYSGFELEFNFNFKETEWSLDNVALVMDGRVVGKTKMSVSAPYNMSYVCGEPLMIVNKEDGTVISISQYQIQPRIPSYDHSYSFTMSPVKVPLLDMKRRRQIEMDDIESDYSIEDEGIIVDPAKPSPGYPTKTTASTAPTTPSPNGSTVRPPDNDDGFGPSVNCIPYFNIAILSTMMVTGIFLVILFYGIVCLMNIKTNNRYEDPSSKPLVHTETS